MFTTLKALVLSFPLALVSGAVLAPSILATPAGDGDTTIPVHANGELTFTSIDVDGTTVTITAEGMLNGTFGAMEAYDTYSIDLTTGAYVGGGLRVANDGSTYFVTYQGQFISETESIGTYTVTDGTGRFEDMTGSGVFLATRYADGSGSSSWIEGTATLTH